MVRSHQKHIAHRPLEVTRPDFYTDLSDPGVSAELAERILTIRRTLGYPDGVRLFTPRPRCSKPLVYFPNPLVEIQNADSALYLGPSARFNGMTHGQIDQWNVRGLNPLLKAFVQALENLYGSEKLYRQRLEIDLRVGPRQSTNKWHTDAVDSRFGISFGGSTEFLDVARIPWAGGDFQEKLQTLLDDGLLNVIRFDPGIIYFWGGTELHCSPDRIAEKRFLIVATQNRPRKQGYVFDLKDIGS